MNLRKLTTRTFIFLLLSWSLSLAATEHDLKLERIASKAAEGKLEEALAEGIEYLEELRASDLPEDHPTIAMTAAHVGTIQAMAGEHEAAVHLLQGALPTISEKLRKGRLLPDELAFTVQLVASLEHLGRPEEALAELAPLVARVRKEIPLGQGAAANLKVDTIEGQKLQLKDALPSEEWLVPLLTKAGMIHLELKQWAEAEQALEKASEIQRRLHPEDQAKLVELREAWEQAARGQGKEIRPLTVGRLSSPRTIRFEGNKSIVEDEIYSALTRSSAYMFASHPSTNFEDYLRKLERCLVLGYRQAGFPDTTVVAEWDGAQDLVVAKIEEGKRFRAGEIEIRGAKLLPERNLLARLISDKDTENPPPSRADRAYQAIATNKHLPADRVQEIVREIFPETAAEGKKNPVDGLDDPKSEFDGVFTSTATSGDNLWEPGKWVDYQDSFLSKVKGALGTAYAEVGRFSTEFKINWVPHPVTGLVDLKVEVIDEGKPLTLGKIHVSGNRVNSREELLHHLGLKEGMELRGDYLEGIKRRLYESARFLGWEVIARFSPKTPGEIDLIIIVAEQWEAPPLAQPLSREQQAFLNFARWLNTKAGSETDLVFKLSGESDLLPVSLEFALGNETAALSWNGFEHQLRAVWEQADRIGLVLRADKGRGFLIEYPLAGTSNLIEGFFLAHEQASPDPYKLATSLVNFGLGTRGTTKNGVVQDRPEQKVVIAIDPATVLAKIGSWNFRGHSTRFEDGDLIVEGSGGLSGAYKLRFDEASGRLLTYSEESEAFVISGGTEVGAVARLGEEMRGLSRDLPNFAEGRHPLSTLFIAVAYIHELVKLADEMGELEDEEIDRAGFIAGVSSRAAERARRWTPLATALGNAFQSQSKKETSPEEPFSIPIDLEDLQANMMAGGTMGILLKLGIYEMAADYIEPGTWPDQVVREILFVIDGKPFYLNQTVESLLENDSIGPLGCLLCGKLLHSVNHPAASRFVAKARGELTERGFTKDWMLSIPGKVEENGIGWRLLKVLQVVTDEQIESLTPADPPGRRVAIKDWLAKVRDLDPKSNADALAPVMGIVWDEFLGETVEHLVDEVEDGMRPRFDPELVAASVNGFPITRGTLRLVEKIDGTDPDAFGSTTVDQCINRLLLAQEMWNRGESARPQAVEMQAELLAKSLGEDGWGQVMAMGLTKEQFYWWSGVIIAQSARLSELADKGKLGEPAVRAFYDSHKDLFGALPEAHVMMITLRNGAAQRERAEKILQRVKQAADMGEMTELFAKEAEAFTGEPGQTSDWIVPSRQFYPALGSAVDSVADESLSGILESSIAGQEFLHLVLIPEKRRPGKPIPFEDVKSEVRQLAIVDGELKRLRKLARIKLLGQPEREDPSPDTPPEAGGLGGTLANIFPGRANERDTEEEEEEEEESPPEGHSLESVLQMVDEGSARHLYQLAAYAEQDLGPDPGMASAIRDHRRSAEAGERRAMWRLSELYRIGRGVPHDETESQRWKERAIAQVDPPALLAPEIDPDAEIIKDISLQFTGKARLEKKQVLDQMRTKLGGPLDGQTLDGDLKRLYESGLVENVTFLKEPHAGGVRLIILIEAVSDE